MTRNLLPEIFLERPASTFASPWSHFLTNPMSRFFDENTLFPFTEEASTRGARIYEEDNKLHVEVPLPGLNLTDIEVSLNKGILLVKGESKEEEKSTKKKFYRYSRRSYSYSVALPTQIDEKQEPQAVYTDGVLNISLQLAKQGETKKISVKAGTARSHTTTTSTSTTARTQSKK